MRKILVVMGALVAMTPLAHAAGVAENVQQALALSAQQKNLAALKAMREATIQVWLKSPLKFAAAAMVEKPHAGFGRYQELKSSTIAKDSKIFVHLEPVGFGWNKQGNMFVSHLVADVALLSPAGKKLWGKKAFGVFKLPSRYRLMDYSMNLTFGLKGVPAGSYAMQITVNDKVLGKSNAVKLPFTIK